MPPGLLPVCNIALRWTRYRTPEPSGEPGGSTGEDSRKDARMSRKALRAASEGGDGASATGGRTGVVVLTTTVEGFSPTDRAASRISASARRRRARQTGESVTKTSCSPDTLASRQWEANPGGRRGRNCWSSASSHKARRRVAPVWSAKAASAACSGIAARRSLGFERGIPTA